MSVCPNCGKVVSDLRKHLRRGRCREQRKHVGYVERKVKEFERKVMT